MADASNIRITPGSGSLYTVSGGDSSSSSSSSGADAQTILNSVTMTNLGNGAAVYQGKGGNYNVFNFRSIEAGAGASVTQTDSTIKISIDTSSIKVNNDTYSHLSNLKDLTIDPKTVQKGQVLTYNGSTWDAETPHPASMSPIYVLQLPIVVKAGVPGVTGFGTLPDGVTASVTDPANPPYNVTVTHNTGMTPIAISVSSPNSLDASKTNIISIGTNTSTTAYTISATDNNSFMIYNCSASNLKMSPNMTQDQTAVIHIIMA